MTQTTNNNDQQQSPNTATTIPADDKGQSQTAKKAMDGITPSDINQDKLDSDAEVQTDDSLLDMMENIHDQKSK